MTESNNTALTLSPSSTERILMTAPTNAEPFIDGESTDDGIH